MINLPFKASAILLLVICLSGSALFAQDKPESPLQNLVGSVTRYTLAQTPEKLYLQTDKPYYAMGDTLWFKAYLFNAAYLKASARSGLVYLEIADEHNIVVKRLMVALYTGLGSGDIVLKEKEFPAGNYTLRAYTNWMRNFDEQYIFKKQFYISSSGEKDLLINSRFALKLIAGKPNATVSMLIRNTQQLPMLLHAFQLKVTEGNKVWYRDKVQTLIDGSLDFNFDIPEKANNAQLAVTVQAIGKNEEAAIYRVPVIFNRPENIDLQFMPEGGAIVAGIKTRIAFKALNEDGKGATVSGEVYNSKQQLVSKFQATHLGMGSFDLMPEAGETYTAKIKLPDGSFSKAYPLPQVKPSGLVLSILNALGNDSLQVNISATADILASHPAYYLVGQARGIGCYGAIVRPNQPVVSLKILKSLFPSGVARISLLNAAMQPLSERTVYIDHHDQLQIKIASNKKAYTRRDSVGLGIAVMDKNGQPVRGSFSIAITDDSQVKNDSLSYSSIKSTLLLSADLKGEIENPGYYLASTPNAALWQQLDNLLLAQGWVNYNWGAITGSAVTPLYNAEASFTVKGKVTNVFNKPVEKSGVVMLSKKPSFFRDTLTDKQGIFNFTNIYPSDTAIYFIQAHNKNGKSFNVGIDVDEFKPPVFAPLKSISIPWYVNIDSSKLKAFGNVIAYKNEHQKLMGNLLKEVKITDRKVIKGSQNLNGDGGSDFAMNSEDLEKAGKMTLGELLAKNVRGFRQGSGKNPYGYFINSQLVHLIIDGIDIDFSRPVGGGIIYSEYVKSYLDYYTAEDITGIEVMKSLQYAAHYVFAFLDPRVDITAHAFVEITTRSGSGPFLKKTPGTYMYKPLAFSEQKEFYSPKYKTKTNAAVLDTRSTIYWSPDVVTDAHGQAKISFYTSDKPGTYTIIMEGADMAGNIGSITTKIVVK